MHWGGNLTAFQCPDQTVWGEWILPASSKNGCKQRLSWGSSSCIKENKLNIKPRCAARAPSCDPDTGGHTGTAAPGRKVLPRAAPKALCTTKIPQSSCSQLPPKDFGVLGNGCNIHCLKEGWHTMCLVEKCHSSSFPSWAL